ncbi:MAG: HD-GYP domain-containing protein, partial [Janthinobacterium lividum]
MLERLARLSAGPSQARVGRMVGRLATLAGLDPPDAERLIAAIPLYDIGMNSVPEAIVRKSGPLNDFELDVLHRHSEIGARLLTGTGSALFDFAAELALCHHEFWNGQGYPRKLAAEQ